MARRAKIGEILLRAGVIDEMQLRSALGEQKRWGGRVGLALINLGFVTERDLVRAVATQFDIPITTISGKRIPRTILSLVTPEFAEEHVCVPLFVREEGGRETLFLGMDDPGNLDVLDALSFNIDMPVRPVMVAPSEICEGLDRFYRDFGSASAPDKNEEATDDFKEGVALETEATVDPVEVSSAALRPTDPTPGGQPAVVPPAIRTLALSQLLIEKGILDRQELETRIRALQEV